MGEIEPVSDETRIIKPVGITMPEPLNIPRVNGLKKGYEPTAVEHLVGNLRNRLLKQTQAAQSYSDDVHRLQNELRSAQEAGNKAQVEANTLRRQVGELQERNKRLVHEAANPYETLGKAGQAFYDEARAQAAKTIEAARKQAEDIRVQADGQAAEAKTQAQAIIEQARAQAKAITDKAREQADETAKRAQAEYDDKAASAERLAKQAQAEYDGKVRRAAELDAKIERTRAEFLERLRKAGEDLKG